MEGISRIWLPNTNPNPSHLPTRAISDITLAVNKVAQTPAVLASYKTLAK